MCLHVEVKHEQVYIPMSWHLNQIKELIKKLLLSIFNKKIINTMSTFISMYKDAQLFSMPDFWSQKSLYRVFLDPQWIHLLLREIFFYKEIIIWILQWRRYNVKLGVLKPKIRKWDGYSNFQVSEVCPLLFWQRVEWNPPRS